MIIRRDFGGTCLLGGKDWHVGGTFYCSVSCSKKAIWVWFICQKRECTKQTKLKLIVTDSIVILVMIIVSLKSCSKHVQWNAAHPIRIQGLNCFITQKNYHFKNAHPYISDSWGAQRPSQNTLLKVPSFPTTVNPCSYTYTSRRLKASKRNKRNETSVLPLTLNHLCIWTPFPMTPCRRDSNHRVIGRGLQSTIPQDQPHLLRHVPTCSS